MLNPNLDTVVFLVDCSSSMRQHISLVNQAISRIENKIIDNSLAINFGVSSFSDHYKQISFDRPLPRLPTHGSTRLYDSAIQVLADLAEHRLPQSTNSLVVVITDGQDNLSSHDPARVAQEVTLAEDVLGWDFLFVGTNQDAYKVGTHMGVKPGKALSFANSHDGFSTMLSSLEGIISQWHRKQLAHSDDFFTNEMKTKQNSLGAIHM